MSHVSGVGGLIAASACHRTALAQRVALSGLPSGAPGTAASVSLRRDALVRRREALLALRSHACAAEEPTPSLGSIEAALAPLLASIVERKANGGAEADPPPPPLLWEVSAALQGALQDEARGPEPDAPTRAAPTGGAHRAAGAEEGVAANAWAAQAVAAPGAASAAAAALRPRLPPGASGTAGKAAEGGQAPPGGSAAPGELLGELQLQLQLAAARRELIARLCCRLQRGWEEIDAIDTRLIVLVTSQAWGVDSGA